MTAKPKNVMLETIKSGLPPERRAAQIYKNKETEETNMDDMNMEITTSEHRAIVFKMNAGEEDIIVLDGEEDVFDVEEEVVEENEEVWEAIDEALHSDEE